MRSCTIRFAFGALSPRPIAISVEIPPIMRALIVTKTRDVTHTRNNSLTCRASICLQCTSTQNLRILTGLRVVGLISQSWDLLAIPPRDTNVEYELHEARRVDEREHWNRAVANRLLSRQVQSFLLAFHTNATLRNYQTLTLMQQGVF